MVGRRVSEGLTIGSIRDEITWLLHAKLNYYLGYFISVA